VILRKKFSSAVTDLQVLLFSSSILFTFPEIIELIHQLILRELINSLIKS